ncbi:MAG: RNA polymerase Rpb4 family protein [archaeon]
MIGKELLGKKPVSLSRVRELLEDRATVEGEASYEQTQTMDYVSKFAKLSKDKAESLFNNLLNIDRMTEEAAVKIVDFLPEDAESMKQVLPKGSELSDSQMGDVLTLIKQHAQS